MKYMKICLLLLWNFLISVRGSIYYNVKVRNKAEEFVNATFTNKFCEISAKAHLIYMHDLTNDQIMKDTIVATMNTLFLKRDEGRNFNEIVNQNKLDLNYIPLLEFAQLSVLNILNAPLEDLHEYAAAKLKMERIYSATKICPYAKPRCNVKAEGIDENDMKRVYGSTKDYHELIYLWKTWRKTFAPVVKEYYTVYTGVSKDNRSRPGDIISSIHFLGTDMPAYNKLVIENTLQNIRVINMHSFSPGRKYFNISYTGNPEKSETEAFYRIEQAMMTEEGNIDMLWHEIEALYTELHKYVMRKLKDFYGDQLDVSDGFIPAHVLGSIYGRSWYNIEPLVRPFPHVSDGNLEDNLQKLSAIDMFKSVDEYHRSLNLSALNSVYKQPENMITKPTDGRVVSCVPQSVDLCNGSYSANTCIRGGFEDLLQVYRVLGKAQYQLQCDSLRLLPERQLTYPFMEIAVADAISLAGTSPASLKNLGLLTDYTDSYESTINHLMKMALIKIPALTVAVTIEHWRSNLVFGRIKSKQVNYHWWTYRKKFGIKPPIKRFEDDLDAAGLSEIVLEEKSTDIFFGILASFQIYKNLSLASNIENPAKCQPYPLFNCDIRSSLRPGNALKESMQRCNLQHWSKIIAKLTSHDKIITQPFWDYFEPLHVYLKKENELAEKLSAPTKRHYRYTITVIIWIMVFVPNIINICLIILATKDRWLPWFNAYWN